MKSYRPLVLSDHLAKVFTRTLLQEASMHLRAYVSRSQHGYGFRAGTSEPLLTTRICVDACNQLSHSWAL
eukprot:8805857-Prorocentrum_lima.AAC.1